MEEQQILLPVTILEFNKGTYEGNAYSNALVRYNGKILKLKINNNHEVDLSEEDVDRRVVLELEITSGQYQQALPRIIGVHNKQ